MGSENLYQHKIESVNDPLGLKGGCHGVLIWGGLSANESQWVP